jgi:hypothetical protein
MSESCQWTCFRVCASAQTSSLLSLRLVHTGTQAGTQGLIFQVAFFWSRRRVENRSTKNMGKSSICHGTHWQPATSVVSITKDACGILGSCHLEPCHPRYRRLLRYRSLRYRRLLGGGYTIFNIEVKPSICFDIEVDKKTFDIEETSISKVKPSISGSDIEVIQYRS